MRLKQAIESALGAEKDRSVSSPMVLDRDAGLFAIGLRLYGDFPMPAGIPDRMLDALQTLRATQQIIRR